MYNIGEGLTYKFTSMEIEKAVRARPLFLFFPKKLCLYSTSPHASCTKYSFALFDSIKQKNPIIGEVAIEQNAKGEIVAS